MNPTKLEFKARRSGRCVSGQRGLTPSIGSAVLLFWLLASAVEVESQAQPAIDWFALGDASATSDGGNYSLTGTMGQAETGAMSGGSYALTGGFWSFDGLPDTSSGIEGDVNPRGQVDGKVTVTDWVQVGRFVAGLNPTSAGAEFQRADCAPRATLGDGRLTISDWVQAGRYAAGLDAVTAAAGPSSAAAAALAATTALIPLARQSAPQRTLALRIVPSIDTTAHRMLVVLNSTGGENALGLSVGFDPKVRHWRSVRVTPCAVNATLLINSSGAAGGRIGIGLALPPAQSFAGGPKELVEIEFVPVDGDGSHSAVSFFSKPLQLEVVDADAQPLPASWIDRVVTIDENDSWPRSALSLRSDGGAATISWPAELGGGVIETSSSIGTKAIWTPVTNFPTGRSGVNTVKVEITDAARFYRLRRQ